MFGSVVGALRSWVATTKGGSSASKWEQICLGSGWGSANDFAAQPSYDEKSLEAITSTAAKVLMLSVDNLMEEVGYYLVTYSKLTSSLLSKMMGISCGTHFSELVTNLPSIYSQVVAPNASSTKATVIKTSVDNREKLSFSFSPGSKEVACLGFLLVGLLRALGERQYNIAKLNVAFRRGPDSTQNFTLTWQYQDNDPDADMMEDSTGVSVDSSESTHVEVGLPPSLLSVAFPFYWVANREMVLVQLGPAFQKSASDVRIGSKVYSHFTVTDPVDIDLKSFSKVISESNSTMVRMTCLSAENESLKLRGHLLFSRQDNLLFFLGQSLASMDTMLVSMVKSRSNSDVQKDSLKRRSTKRLGKRASVASPSASSVSSSDIKVAREQVPNAASHSEESDDMSPSAPDAPESPSGPSGNVSDGSPRSSPPGKGSIYIPPLMGAPTRQEEDDSTPIENVLRRIFTEVLGIPLKTAYDDQFLECMYKLKKNCISSLGLLFRLPSPRAIEKLGLPILIESELINLYSLRSHFEEPVFSRITPKEEKISPAGEAGGSSNDSPANSPKSDQKSAVLGITDDMRVAIKQTWTEISTARTNGSLLNQFFDHLMKDIASLDTRASGILESMQLRDQSDTLLGLLAFIVRAIDDPIKSISSTRQVAVRFLVLGFDKLTFPSLAAAIANSVEKTLGTEKVPPMIREAWFALTQSMFDRLVAEYESLKEGIVGRLWKLHDRKWRLFDTLLLPDRVIFYREGSQLGEKKEEIILSYSDTPAIVKDLEGTPTQCGFVIENSHGSKSQLCAENEAALTQWTNDLSRRVRALAILSSSTNNPAAALKRGK